MRRNGANTPERSKRRRESFLFFFFQSVGGAHGRDGGGGAVKGLRGHICVGAQISEKKKKKRSEVENVEESLARSRRSQRSPPRETTDKGIASQNVEKSSKKISGKGRYWWRESFRNDRRPGLAKLGPEEPLLKTFARGIKGEKIRRNSGRE